MSEEEAELATFKKIIEDNLDLIEKYAVKLCSHTLTKHEVGEGHESVRPSEHQVFLKHTQPHGFKSKTSAPIAWRAVSQGEVDFPSFSGGWSIRGILRQERGWLRVKLSPKSLRPPIKFCKKCPNLLRCTMEGILEDE